MTTYTEEGCPDKDFCYDPHHSHVRPYNELEYILRSFGVTVVELSQATHAVREYIEKKIIGENFSNWGELDARGQRIKSAQNDLKAEQRERLKR